MCPICKNPQYILEPLPRWPVDGLCHEHSAMLSAVKAVMQSMFRMLCPNCKGVPVSDRGLCIVCHGTGMKVETT